MVDVPTSKATDAGALTGDELVLVSELSASVTITGTTISAAASDNSYNDSGNGFVTAGFAVGNHVKVVGFTGNTANNIFSAKITALTAGKMTIGGTDGDVIVDDAAGESVTITKWVSRRTTVEKVAAALDQGTSFPGSPSSGDRFLRTDRNIEYFYDGTRWLSSQLFDLPLMASTGVTSFTGTNISGQRASYPWAGTYDLWVEHAAFTWNYSASASWTLNLAKFDGGTATNIATHNPSFVDTDWHSTMVVVDAVVANSTDMFTGGATENSGTATFSLVIGLTYRLVG